MQPRQHVAVALSVAKGLLDGRTRTVTLSLASGRRSLTVARLRTRRAGSRRVRFAIPGAAAGRGWRLRACVKLKRTRCVQPRGLMLVHVVTVAPPAAGGGAGAPPPAPGTPSPTAVMLAAGDIASCTYTGDSQTAALLTSSPANVVATLGDNAYDTGSATEFANCYDPTWGAVKGKTAPSAGNHDYQTSGASGYFGYFGAAAGDPAKGYYSYDAGSWHVVVLNSSCSAESVHACVPDPTQLAWLQGDLLAHPAACTLAYWHHPLFTSDSDVGESPAIKPFWDDLSAAGADLVLNGHAHTYERFAPQTPDGVVDGSRGIREIIAGTGGYPEHSGVSPAPNSEVFNNDTFGVLRLVLRPGGYDWRFLPVAGGTFTDAGSGSCH